MKFLNYIKSKFVWILLFVFVDVFSIIYFFSMFDSLFTAMYMPLSIPLSMLSYVSEFPLIISFIAFYILFRVFAFLSLRIYSYKLYVGNNNWYKFVCELDKLHKLEDKRLYKMYLNGGISIEEIKLKAKHFKE